MQVNVRRFAYLFVWISFLFRPIVIAVLWKDSREFSKIIRQKGGDTNRSNGAGQVMDT